MVRYGFTPYLTFTFICIYFIFSVLLLIFTTFLCYQYYYKDTLFSLSSIASVKQMDMISRWIDSDAKIKYVLMYKASKNGDSSDAFHKKCDNVTNTVTLITTIDGWKFGGYTDSSWKSLRDQRYQDEISDSKPTHKTFIFSLNLLKKYPPIFMNPFINCGKDKGPTFGSGPDIGIASNCLSKESQCNSPTSFSGMKKSNEFNGGKSKFIVKEMEVFYVEVE